MRNNKLIKFTRFFINIIVITAFMLGTAGTGLASASVVRTTMAAGFHAAPVPPGSLKLALETGELLKMIGQSATGVLSTRRQSSGAGQLGFHPSLYLQSPFTDCSAVSEIPQSECEALVAFYNATDGAIGPIIPAG